MTKAKFEIGETEKHTIIVNASALLKYIKREVDGEKVVNEANFQPLPKKFQLDVGNSEKHHLEISAGPFSISNYSWTEKKLKKPETASPARKVSKLNSFSSTQYRDRTAR